MTTDATRPVSEAEVTDQMPAGAIRRKEGRMSSYQIRQGDVLLTAVGGIPDGATVVPPDRGRVILAYGEVTGHAHQVADAASVGAELLSVSGQADRWLRMRSAGRLVHEEHAAIAIPAGTWRVRIQREWTDADEPRKVVD